MSNQRTRIYEIECTTASKSPRLVRASSANAAIRHVTKELFDAEVASQERLVTLLSAGTEVEDAGEEKPEPAE